MSKHYSKKIALVLAFSALLSARFAQAENVEIYLKAMLDNTQGSYCIDIAGAQGIAANPEDGLQGHTCHSPSGVLVIDQIFDAEKFADAVLYMPEFNVCAEASSTDAGTKISLAACDGSPEQSFGFSGEGAIVHNSDNLKCLTLSEVTNKEGGDKNQTKVLTLESCANAKAAYQVWAIRSSL